MNIKLLAHTPDAVRVAFTAIRTCYSPHSADHIWNKDFAAYKEKNNDHLRLIKQIVNHGHTSTLEHITFTFSVEGVSRVLLAQLTRHRVGFSYSVQSQRYVKMNEDSSHGGFQYYTPEEFVQDSYLDELYYTAMKKAQESYNDLIRAGAKAEDARMVLPNATTTNLILSVNLRALLDFYHKRNRRTHAQREIADFAETLRSVVEEVEPWTAALFKGDE